MDELRVEAITSVIRSDPSYHPADAFADDRYLAGLISDVENIADRLGVSATDLRYLRLDQDGSVADRALSRVTAVADPQPLYVARSGIETDPFVAFLPTLVHDHPSVTDALVLTHLEALSGSAIFEFLSWSMSPAGAALLLVDEQVVTTESALPPKLSAVAMRVHPGPGGTQVSAWGTGSPPTSKGSVHITGRRSCDAWLGFTRAVASDDVRAGDVVVLHTRDDAQEGWVQLQVDALPVLLP
ncbi:hypothetical protein LFM09_15905 [Lentzea alba]|uniref:hypothetical protein n=1 Tax=Lentzea alba TaxID=2714351 RepID=UPI0039BEF82B